MPARADSETVHDRPPLRDRPDTRKAPYWPFFAAALITALPAAAGEGTGERELPPSVVFGRVATSVVVVEATLADGHSQGSGVIIARGLVVTNHHVIAGSKAIEVHQGDQRWSAMLEAFDPKLDLALLRVADLDRPRVASRPSSLVQVGEHVYAIGAPQGLELSLSDGLVAALRPDKERGASLIQTTAPVSPGSSGGGLFDTQGRLVGIITFTATGQNLNFAHPTEWIEKLQGSGKPVAAATPTVQRPPPQYSIARRPKFLRCSLKTQSVWGLFSGGAEVLETHPTTGLWWLQGADTETPVLSRGTKDTESLVLSDLNRQVGMVRFTPIQPQAKREYFFSVDDEGMFSLTFLEPVDFHGQLRMHATTGPCDGMSQADLDALRKKEGEERLKKELDRAVTERNQAVEAVRAARQGGNEWRLLDALSRACEFGHGPSCQEGADIANSLNQTSRAKELRKRATQPSAPAAATGADRPPSR